MPAPRDQQSRLPGISAGKASTYYINLNQLKHNFLQRVLLNLLQPESKVQVFDTPQVSTVLRSNLMRLYFPVDLTGNLIMIEKLVSDGTWTGDLPIFSPTR